METINSLHACFFWRTVWAKLSCDSDLLGGKLMKVSALLFLGLASAFSALAAQAPESPSGAPGAPSGLGEIKDKYHVVQVDQFDVKQGVEFPPEYLKKVQEETSKQLADAKLFEEVLQPGQHPAQAEAPVIRLSGTIHNYKQGSRKKRYLAGSFGAGNAEIDAQVAFVDAASGDRLVIEELRAVLTSGLFGGSEDRSTQELARQIVTQTKLMLARRLPAPAEGGKATTTTGGAEAGDHTPASDRQTLTRQTLAFNAKKWSEGQQQLEQNAAAGYCVVDFSLTGSSTAELELEKSAAPPKVCQYRWVHIRLANHLQKEISQATDDGFHAFPHSLATLGPYLTVLMQKPPAPSTARYHYLVAEPLRMSSAKKDTETNQREGYTLLDETELGGMHILLFERVADEAKR
jgi:uncharacterized protein DUF4410